MWKPWLCMYVCMLSGVVINYAHFPPNSILWNVIQKVRRFLWMQNARFFFLQQQNNLGSMKLQCNTKDMRSNFISSEKN